MCVCVCVALLGCTADASPCGSGCRCTFPNAWKWICSLSPAHFSLSLSLSFKILPKSPNKRHGVLALQVCVSVCVCVLCAPQRPALMLPRKRKKKEAATRRRCLTLGCLFLSNLETGGPAERKSSACRRECTVGRRRRHRATGRMLMHHTNVCVCIDTQYRHKAPSKGKSHQSKAEA